MTLSEALASLGSTEDEVVETLRKAGVRGMRNNGYECVIARYLSGATGQACLFGPSLFKPHWAAEFLIGESDEVIGPRHVQRVASDFDAGRYPELEET